MKPAEVHLLRGGGDFVLKHLMHQRHSAQLAVQVSEVLLLAADVCEKGRAPGTWWGHGDVYSRSAVAGHLAGP